MIESISTSSVQSSALRQQPQSNSSLQVEVEVASKAALPSTRIRVDNQLDRAIIEVRSSDSGQVLRQYPTEAQLRAFARAESLKAARQHAENSRQNAELARATGGDGAPAPKTEVKVQSSAPASASASDVSVALNGAGGSASTQSVEV